MSTRSTPHSLITFVLESVFYVKVFQPGILPQISGDLCIKSIGTYLEKANQFLHFWEGILSFHDDKPLYHQSFCANPPIRKLAECRSVEKSKSS